MTVGGSKRQATPKELKRVFVFDSPFDNGWGVRNEWNQQ
jgi:hypothetical protein